MTSDTSPVTDESLALLRSVIEKHWGYRTFRPLQEEAMHAMLSARDSLVVLPTGGGKSLCYQAPALIRPGTTLVVSPLISLMKDQVDSLLANGIPAAQIDSSLSPNERRAIEHEVRQGAIRLLFCSPERLVTAGFQSFLREAGVNCFAIDEAHCISHWGHDFRPEYRQLSQLKEFFPGASVHAFTATATEQVRSDIIRQLRLEDPEILVGDFDRPNLTYRVLPRHNETAQIIEVLERHKNEAGIIYCIRRKDVDELTADLNARGYKAMPYHAGMTPDQRRKAQEAFSTEACDLIIATVAFGMGIDRSNLRFVLHTGMPKSIEAYQQETGRAGRDGLEAECVLLYSGQDAMVWRSIVERSAQEAIAAGEDLDPDFVPAAIRHIDDMDRFARGAVCRHKALVEYFGQPYLPPVPAESDAEADPDADPAGSCHACDLCLGDVELVPDAVIIAQKILSGVARTGERFGAGHVISVLRGENTERVRQLGHDQLPTFGLLREHDKGTLRNWIHQLVGQKTLVQEMLSSGGHAYPILRLNRASWEVMKKQRDIRLVQPARKPESAKRARDDAASWEGVDRELFEALRGLRRELAAQRNVPPYVIFSDATLRELARLRPSTMERMRLVYGVGESKLKDYGPRVLPLIVDHCQARRLAMDVALSHATSPPPAEPRRPARVHPLKQQAFALFAQGASLEDVAHQTRRARATLVEYLCDWIRETRPASVGPWVTDRVYHQVHDAARQVGTERLKPIFLALNEAVPYDEIHIVITHLDAAK